jgi:hypothetical protein
VLTLFFSQSWPFVAQANPAIAPFKSTGATGTVSGTVGPAIMELAAGVRCGGSRLSSGWTPKQNDGLCEYSGEGDTTEGVMNWITGFPGLYDQRGILIGNPSASAIRGAISATNGCTPYTPTDQSGANPPLPFGSVDVQLCQDGNFVHLFGVLVFPPTNSPANVALSIPVIAPNRRDANNSCGIVVANGAQNSYVCAVKNTSTMQIYATAGGNRTNADLSGKTVSFFLTYPTQ